MCEVPSNRCNKIVELSLKKKEKTYELIELINS